MDPGDYKNVYGTPRLQRPNFTLKLQGCAKVFRVKLGLCNLGFPYTFLESSFITDHCHVFSLLVTCLAGLQTHRGYIYGGVELCIKSSYLTDLTVTKSLLS